MGEDGPPGPDWMYEMGEKAHSARVKATPCGMGERGGSLVHKHIQAWGGKAAFPAGGGADAKARRWESCSVHGGVGGQGGGFSWSVGSKEGLGQKLSLGLRLQPRLGLGLSVWPWPHRSPSRHPHVLTHSIITHKEIWALPVRLVFSEY